MIGSVGRDDRYRGNSALPAALVERIELFVASGYQVEPPSTEAITRKLSRIPDPLLLAFCVFRK